MGKKIKGYKPVKDAVDIQDAMYQAITANEEAAKIAQAHNDAPTMAAVAYNWVAIAERIQAIQQSSLEELKAEFEQADLQSDTALVENKVGFSPR